MKSKVFVNNINKNIKNNREIYHFIGKDNNDDIDIIDVSESSVRNKLNDIFDSSSFVYKSRVNIKLKDGNNIDEDIIAIKDNNLITLSNKKIPIDDILDIKKA